MRASPRPRATPRPASQCPTPRLSASSGCACACVGSHKGVAHAIWHVRLRAAHDLRDPRLSQHQRVPLLIAIWDRCVESASSAVAWWLVACALAVVVFTLVVRRDPSARGAWRTRYGPCTINLYSYVTVCTGALQRYRLSLVVSGRRVRWLPTDATKQPSLPWRRACSRRSFFTRRVFSPAALASGLRVDASSGPAVIDISACQPSGPRIGARCA